MRVVKYSVGIPYICAHGHFLGSRANGFVSLAWSAPGFLDSKWKDGGLLSLSRWREKDLVHLELFMPRPVHDVEVISLRIPQPHLLYGILHIALYNITSILPRYSVVRPVSIVTWCLVA